MSYSLEPYQDRFYNDIARACSSHKSVLAQSETGSGKTVIFAKIAANFLSKTKKDVIIFVDSESIFTQTRQTLFNWYKIDSDTINRDSSHIKRNTLFGEPRVFVAMVETFDRRSERESFLTQIRDVGLVIIDECHMGNFVKIFDHFVFALRIGFTATPIYSNKKRFINQDYDCIVCGPTTSELIKINEYNPHRSVVMDATYSESEGNINRKEIEDEQNARGWKGLDFDQELVGDKLSGNRQVGNTVSCYIKHALGKKMLCFNANVKHSRLVCDEFVKSGFDAKHMDADCGKDYKKGIYQWIKDSKSGILCNVGMTTKGFDEKSIEGVILNTLTKSITKYRQMVGRGARAYQYPDGTFKNYNIVIDMCDNVLGGGHGQWSDDIDWKFLFENPKRQIRLGVAPKKECPECGFICPANARFCRGVVQNPFDGDMVECGYEFPIEEKGEDTNEKELTLISKNIDVDKIINFPRYSGKPDWFTYRETVRACAYFFSKDRTNKVVERDEYEELWKLTYAKIVEWQIKKGRMENGRKIRDTEWYTSDGREKLLQFLRNDYGMIVNLVEENVIV